MPIITVQFIEDVVATPEQKRELIVRLTDTFVGILGDVVRPFVYCIIQETPQKEWGIAGVPMPDLVYLTGEKHAQVIERSNELMRGAIAQMAAAQSAQQDASAQADAVWRGADSGSSGASSTSDADRRYWERWFDELWNKGNYDIVYEYVAPGFTAHGAGGQDIKMGPEGPRDMVKVWKAAMPDGHMTIDDIVTEGDLSMIRMTWEGTHTGKFYDVPASGKHIKVSSTGIDRVVNGKITEGWGELDMFGMMQQMGAIPGPQQQEEQPGAAPAQPQHQAAPAPVSEKDAIECNKETIHQFHHALNTKTYGAIWELVRPDFVNHVNADTTQVGQAGLLNGLRPFHVAIPDLRIAEDYVVAQGDRVAARVYMSGTHQGVFMGAQPTGKTVGWSGIVIYRLHEDGRIVERWQDFDLITMMQQLGVIPSQ